MTSPEWHPGIERRTLTGVPAGRLSAAASWLLWCGMACAVVGALFWAADHTVLAAVLILPGGVGISTARLLDTLAGTRKTREMAAGYTTLVEGRGPVDAEHVDARSGRLVSFAGEDLTGVERRARVAAIRADTRLGAERPDRALTGGGGALTPVTDAELFAGRPRTVVTLPWTVRQGVVWGVALVALGPLGLFAYAWLDAGAATRSVVAPVTLGAVLLTAGVGVVLLIVSARRADRILADGGPGPSARTQGLVLSLWIVPLGIAAVFGACFVVAVTDVAGLGHLVSARGLDRAVVLSAVWAVPWFVVWAVLVRRAAAR
ncbi:hypothetical protein [Promicromonospora sp. NPDC090134]|uniref:hypothetical protein n=1 Tax=Promicromonospora sp. NPDC090134 TaxID=3364408 RepID=UPI0038307212